jgi:putative transcriptional regulator
MEYRSTVNFIDYGNTQLRLDAWLKQNKITINKLATLTNAEFKTIKRLCTEKVERLDMDLLARICYVLDCEPGDLIVYHKPKNELPR